MYVYCCTYNTYEREKRKIYSAASCNTFFPIERYTRNSTFHHAADISDDFVVQNQ